MSAEKPTGIIDGIVDRNVTINGKVYFAGEKVKPHLAKFHQGDTVTYSLDRKMKGTIDTMFPSTVFGSQIKSPPEVSNKTAGAAASATPAAPAGQPAVTPPPATSTAPVVGEVAAPKAGGGKLPQENREERICRECCLKCAVEMLKGQPGFLILTEKAQENRVIEAARVFFIYIMNGAMPGKEG